MMQVIEKLQELLSKVDGASVEAAAALAKALLAPPKETAPLGMCAAGLGNCTYKVDGDEATAHCISEAQCDVLGGTWQVRCVHGGGGSGDWLIITAFVIAIVVAASAVIITAYKVRRQEGS